MKNSKLWVMAGLLGILGSWGCDTGTQRTERQLEQRQPAVALNVPDFNADSAYQFVARQVAFGPRVPNTPAHRATGDWLIRTLEGYGAQVQVQAFRAQAYNGQMLDLRNIIASYNPQAARRVLLAAHWDTRPYADKDDEDPRKPIDGANDGASGVGVLLEIARQLGQAGGAGPAVGVDLILFDGEDYGQPEDSTQPFKDDTWCLGSQHWSANKHKPNYTAAYGILLDMVGAKGAKFAREEYSRRYANDVVQKVWNTANRIGYSDFFVYQDSPGIIDDHYYVNTRTNIRMIDIIEFDQTSSDGYFADYHHTHDDNMDLIDPRTLKAVGQTVLHVLYQEGQAI
jgi:glutaminyl-peptide cyclotransferase